MKSDAPYLSHIADSIAAIESYVAGGRGAFLSQRMIQDAVIRNFEIIGEAANRLSPAARANSAIPSHRMVNYAKTNEMIGKLWHGFAVLTIWPTLDMALKRRRQFSASATPTGQSPNSQ